MAIAEKTTTTRKRSAKPDPGALGAPGVPVSKSSGGASGAVGARLLEAANAMCEAQTGGDYEAYVDVTAFSGVAAGIAEAMNRSVRFHVESVLDILGLVGQYAEGDLSATLRPFVGKEAVANEIADKLRGSLVSLVEDAGALCGAAVRGELSIRADASRHQGDFGRIVQSVNETLDSVVGPLNIAAWYVEQISRGAIPEPITEEYNGDFNAIKDNLNQCIAAVNLLVADADTLAKAAVEGRLETRADASRHQGDFGRVVAGVNETLDAVIGPLNVAADYVDRISRGAIPAPITEEYNGDFNAIKDNLNQCIAAVNLLVADADTLAKAAVEGRLETRADASRHQGDFRKFVEGVNETLDAVIGPVQEATGVLEQIADRDLAARMVGNYQGDHTRLKDALNQAVANLDEGLQQVAMAAEQVSSAASQIGSGSQAVAQGASEQASSLEEISSSLQEMSSMTRQNAANAQEARGLSDGARTSVATGVDSMQRLSEAIDRIKHSSDDTAKIVKTIDEIAFQTNLLALNAAVEAARAGDAGKGFAVVAEEVRNLAMRSAEAAKNTANLIEGSVKNAEQGVAINQEVFANLEEINTQVRKVGEVMAEIAAASEQQNEGIEQVNQAVAQMDQVTQQNAANSEESASAAQELASQSEEMNSLVATYQLTEARASRARGGARGFGVVSAGAGATSRTAVAGGVRPARRPTAPLIPMPGDGARGRGQADDDAILQDF